MSKEIAVAATPIKPTFCKNSRRRKDFWSNVLMYKFRPTNRSPVAAVTLTTGPPTPFQQREGLSCSNQKSASFQINQPEVRWSVAMSRVGHQYQIR